MKKILIICVIFSLCFLPLWLKRHKSGRLSTTNVRNTVTLWTLQMGDFEPYMKSVITEFEEQNPDIKINWIDVPFSEGEKRTLAAIMSDNPPDLINLNPDFSAILAQKGALEKIREEDLSQFNPQIVKSLIYNDNLYAIPWYATSAITIYNKKLFAKTGIRYVPKSYREMGIVAQAVKNSTGAYIFMPTISENDTMLKILNKYGINSPQNINSADSKSVFDYFKELYAQDLIPKESITQTHREALEKYMSGQIVFFQAGANFLNLIKENAPEIYDQTDVSRQTIGWLGQYDFSLMNLVIPVKSQNKEAALKFALFLTNEKNQLALGKLTNVLVTNKSALKDSFYTNYDYNDLTSKARVLSAKQLDNINPALRQSKGQKEVNLLINTAVQKILLGKADTAKVLDDVAKKWKLILE